MNNEFWIKILLKKAEAKAKAKEMQKKNNE